MGRKRKLWSYSVGRRPYTVRVEEFEPGGNIYVGVWSRKEKKQRYRSLRHKDRPRAMDQAEKLAARLREGGEAVLQGNITLERLFRLYREHRTPLKAPDTQKDDGRRFDMFLRFFRPSKRADAISLAEWEKFIALRMSGAMDARGNDIPVAARKPAGPRTTESDLRWLKAVLTWGTKWKTAEGAYLLRENPVRGFDFPKEKNPRRPIATHDRFERIRAVSDRVTMDVTWGAKRETVRSHLSELLDIVNGTGRRISAVCQLRYEDLRLDNGPYGSIRWPADTDKMGRESVVPIGPEVRAAIDRILQERPGIGRAPLFPAPKGPSEPIRYELASDWLLAAERLAGVPKQHGALWHAYRRKWATERKHLPNVDVAAAGGWSNPRTLVEIYQQPDQDSMLQVVLGGGQLRESGP